MITAALTADFRATDKPLRITASDTDPGKRMFNSRLIGALFLAGFLAYGTGFALVTSVISAPDFLANIALHKTTLVVGALLMAINPRYSLRKRLERNWFKDRADFERLLDGMRRAGIPEDEI